MLVDKIDSLDADACEITNTKVTHLGMPVLQDCIGEQPGIYQSEGTTALPASV